MTASTIAFKDHKWTIDDADDLVLVLNTATRLGASIVINTPPPKTWVEKAEAAERLSVSTKQIDRWLKAGHLVRMHESLSGRKVLVSVESIERLGK